jgi:DNA-binding MarR family transcriptional regulator
MEFFAMTRSPTKPGRTVEPDDVDAFIAQRARVSPGVNTEGMAVFGRIVRIAAQMAPHMETLFARHGLERGEFDVLATLQRSGPPYRLTPTQLYTTLMVSSGGLTHRLKRLAGAGLVQRIPSQDDGRSLAVQLTPRGLACVSAAFEEDMRLEEGWLAVLSPNQREQLIDLLRILGRAIPKAERRDPGDG